jgi:DNA-directed RNA polymerase specialized sigma24 family protein
MAMSERSRAERRREVLRADLDRFEQGQALWGDREGETAAGETLRDAVRAAVAAALTDKQREVVEACFFEGLSQGEVARRLGIAQQVVQKRLYGAPRGGRLVGGAMARLREALAGFAPGAAS